MKKLIQITLVVVLVFVLFQAVTSGSTISSDTIGSNIASHVSPTVTISADNAQVAACLVSIKGVPCVRPHVGWNS